MRYNLNMGYHKTNLKERLTQIAWDICNEQSWQQVNMRSIAKIAGVSSTAIYRHFTSKNDLKAALMIRGYQLLSHGTSLNTSNDFSSILKGRGEGSLKEPATVSILWGLGKSSLVR